MGALQSCFPCLGEPEAPRDPLLDAQARQRAADAAAARMDRHEQSAAGKAAKKAAARDKQQAGGRDASPGGLGMRWD